MKFRAWIEKKTGKMLAAAAVTVILGGIAAQAAFAMGWETDSQGRRYQQEDFRYATGWKWIDGACYYFDDNGYVLTNTTTPDGYIVDLAGAWTLDGVRQENPGMPVQLPRYAVSTKYLAFVPPVAWEKYYSYEVEESGSINFYYGNGGLIFSVRVLPVDSEDMLENWENVRRIGKLTHYGKTTHAVFRADAIGQLYDPAENPDAAAEQAWLRSYEPAVLKSLYGIYSYTYVPAEE